MSVDSQFKLLCQQILDEGIKTAGRTQTDRIRLLSGALMEYDCSDGMMGAFTLRKNNPNLAVAETMAFLMGSRNMTDLTQAHPGLQLWEAWASESGQLGGVYGDAFYHQFPKVIKGLKENPLSTHHRMTTLIPQYFPIPGNTYTENVNQGRYSLMPCLHSYHFLSDGESLTLHATQASGDVPVGVFPHNAYQVQFMLLLVAHLTGLKPKKVIHHVHDAHIYENQMFEVKAMLGRDSIENERIPIHFDMAMHVSRFNPMNITKIRRWVTTEEFQTHPPLKMNVDS